MTDPIDPTVTDTLEDDLSALDVLEWDLSGFTLRGDSVGLVYDSGLDGVGEVSSDDQQSPGDGVVPGLQKIDSRAVVLGLSVVGEGATVDDRAAAIRDVLHDLRLVTSPMEDRWNGRRLLRWRRRGEPAKRLWYRPGPGEPLDIPGDEARLIYNGADITCRVDGTDPTIYSDVLHTVELEAGVLTNIVNAGSRTAREPDVGWSLSCDNPTGLVLTNITWDASWKFPAGPVTVSPTLDIEGPDGSFGVVYGPGSTLFPASICLRPGVNVMKATEDCTFSWRDIY